MTIPTDEATQAATVSYEYAKLVWKSNHNEDNMTIRTSKHAAGALRRLRSSGVYELADWNDILAARTARPTNVMRNPVPCAAFEDLVFISGKHTVAYLITYSTVHSSLPTQAQKHTADDTDRSATPAKAELPHAESVISKVDNPRAAGLEKFKKGFGLLKGRNVFGSDAVEFQRELREEWQ